MLRKMIQACLFTEVSRFFGSLQLWCSG